MRNYLDLLKKQFNDRIDFFEKREGIYQIVAPFYHEDGDMYEIYLETNGNGKIRLSDHGMTIMRLSYSYDIDTPNKERIFQKILSENRLTEEDGRIYIETEPQKLYMAILQFTQGIGKVSNMSHFKREVIRSLFYEMLDEFVMNQLKSFEPIPRTMPIPERDDLEVDYELKNVKKPIFIFGVKDAAKARLITISCLEFQRVNIPFKSVVIHEDWDALTKKDIKRITSAADKQFPGLDVFKENGINYLMREAA